MQLQQTFWQQKLSPKQLIIDWDKFIILFDEWILQTISLKLNHVQKSFIKSLIDPQSRNLVYKNSYLLFVRDFWQLPSNRTKLLKGQINLSKVPKIDFSGESKDDDNVLLRVQYISDHEKSQSLQENLTKSSPHNRLTQKIYQMRKNRIYTLDPKLTIISENEVNTESFLTLGRGSHNDICIDDCEFINQEHLKLVKLVTKRKKQKKPYYMMDDDEDKTETETRWYIRDVSKSNRLQYAVHNDTTYVVVRPGMSVKIGLTDQYELQIVKATPPQTTQSHIQQLTTLLNSDRINYLGEIDPSVPEKFITNIPTEQCRPADIQHWFNKGYHYDQKQAETLTSVRKIIANDGLGQEEDLPLVVRLVDRVTQQVKEYKFYGESVKVGRNAKTNKVVVDRVNVRNVQCEFVFITGVWMVKNVKENCLIDSPSKPLSSSPSKLKKVSDPSDDSTIIKRLKMRELSVELATDDSVQNLQSSSRIYLQKGCKHEIKGKNFILSIGFPQKKE